MAADPTPFKSMPGTRPGTRTIPPVQVQLDHMAAVINKLVEAVGDIELRQMFTMRQIRMGRTKPGALVDPTTGKLPVQHITLADLFDQQREVFVQQLMQEMEAERNEDARTQAAAEHQGDNESSGEGGAAEAEGNGHADGTGIGSPGPRLVTES